MNRLAAVAFMLAISGCSTYGERRILENRLVAKIVIGKTTKNQVERIFGKPMGIELVDDVSEKWIYLFTKDNVRPVTFIPIIGIFGGIDSREDSLAVLFTKDGVVEHLSRGQIIRGGGAYRIQDGGKSLRLQSQAQ